MLSVIDEFKEEFKLLLLLLIFVLELDLISSDTLVIFIILLLF